METMVDSSTIEPIRDSLGFEASCIVDSCSNKGGLAMLWRIGNSVQVLGSSNNFSDVVYNGVSWVVGELPDSMVFPKEIEGKLCGICFTILKEAQIRNVLSLEILMICYL